MDTRQASGLLQALSIIQNNTHSKKNGVIAKKQKRFGQQRSLPDKFDDQTENDALKMPPSETTSFGNL